MIPESVSTAIRLALQLMDDAAVTLSSDAIPIVD